MEMEKKTRFSMWYFILAFVVLLVIQSYLGVHLNVKRLSYSQFKNLLKDGKIKTAVLSEEQVQGIFIDAEDDKEKTFSAVRVEDETLVPLLEVGMADFEEAIDRVIAGLEKKNRVINPEEKRIVAYHESGHAMVASSMYHVDPVHRVSIIPRGIGALGHTLQLPTEDRYLMTKTELLERIKVLLGGRVAEEIAFNDISTGASNDLQKATDIAKRMVKEYGMSEMLGLATFEAERTPFLNLDVSRGKDYSDITASQIDEEIKHLLDESHREVKELLQQKWDKLEKLATQLLEDEVVEGEPLRELLE